MPGDYKDWLKLAFQWGPVAAIVFFLLFQSAGWIPSIAGEVKDEVKNVGEAVQSHEGSRKTSMEKQTDALKSLIQLNQESVRLYRLACLREAKTEADRQTCLGSQ